MTACSEGQEIPANGRGGLFKRFSRNKDGATAIEFAALSIPFMLLLFAILESCIAFAAQQLMTNITDDVARQVRTGQLRGLTEPVLRQTICARLELVVSAGCPGLSVDLRSYATFQAAADEAPLKFTADNDVDTSKFAVSPGASKTRNMLRVVYRWPVMVDMLRSSMSNLKDNKTLFFATSTWRNESFED